VAQQFPVPKLVVWAGKVTIFAVGQEMPDVGEGIGRHLRVLHEPDSRLLLRFAFLSR
jgi:hypothetical protein